MCTGENKLMINSSMKEVNHDAYIGHRNPIRFLLLDALVVQGEFLSALIPFNSVIKNKVNLIQRQIDKLVSFDNCT